MRGFGYNQSAMPEAHERIEALLAAAQADGRSALFEHEGYQVIAEAGIAEVPRHVFVPLDGEVSSAALADLGSSRVVVKIVSAEITHKTEAGGVAFVANNSAAVQSAIRDMYTKVRRLETTVNGVLLCACVERVSDSLGHELLVGLRMSREFGPVVTAGLGGTATESLAQSMKPGQAAVIASAVLSSPERFMTFFRTTLAYALLAGNVRGRRRAVEDERLLYCFQGLFDLARRFSFERSVGSVRLEEFEINPLLVSEGRLIALDAVARLSTTSAFRPPRPIRKIAQLLRPRSIAVVGVSSKSLNMGRIILRNIRDGGFDSARLHVVKPGDERIDNVACVPTLADLPEKADLVVLAVGAAQVPACIEEIVTHDAAEAVIVIPGGMGETAAGADIERAVKERLVAAHLAAGGGPVVLGGNCMGVQSRIGRYDTFFIPAEKWEPRMEAPPRRLAFVSQSGAFLITRLSNVGCLDPAYAVTVGNQIDLTVSDVVAFLADEPDIDVYGVYVEGLIDGDGLQLAEAVQRIARCGKTVVVYRAGRTPAGRSATAGHTSVLAGDYDACAAILAQAGALVASSFREFEQLLELSTTLHERTIAGPRLGVVTNAGFEAVGMADALIGADYRVALAQLAPESHAALKAMLAERHLDAIVNSENPLDLTPMAGDDVYERAVRILLDDPQVDALVVSLVPLTPTMRTTAAEIGSGRTLVQDLAELRRTTRKPLIVVIDAGSQYDVLAAEFRLCGVAVFRSADQAVAALGRYLAYRLSRLAQGQEHCTDSRRQT